MSNHTQFTDTDWGLAEFLPVLASNYYPPALHLLSSWDQGMSHCTQPYYRIFAIIFLHFFLLFF
jgi:hypothetical protein